MANNNNLIQNKNLTPSQRRENARKAGIASAKAKRERKLVKSILSEYLNNPINNAKLKGRVKNIGLQGECNKEAFIIAPLLKKATEGDVRAIEYVMKLIGEQPQEEVSVSVSDANDPISDLQKQLKKVKVEGVDD